MKYISLEVAFNKVPASKDNFLLALKRIGEIDPKNIKRTTLKYKFAQKTEFTDSDYVKRGILNVRKVLNSNLGKNGKYKNRMFQFISGIKVREKGNEHYCWTRIPHSEYTDIVNATYKLLKQVDSQYCDYLLNLERNDVYKVKAEIKKIFLETTAPVQTHVVLMSLSTFFNKNQHRALKKTIRR